MNQLNPEPKASTTPGQPPRPTPGRIVYYVPKYPVDGGVRPAIVVRVYSDVCVSLQVFTDGSNDGPGAEANGVMHVTSVMQDPTGQQPRSWHWMPYQVGQAQKTDAVAGELAKRVATLEARVFVPVDQIGQIGVGMPAAGETSAPAADAPKN